MTGQEAVDNIRKLVIAYLDDPLYGLALDVLNDPRFLQGFGASVNGTHGHHAYSGGLAVHTLEVILIALDIAKVSCLKVNIPVLLTAAVFHDYMKVEDYDCNGSKTEYRKLVRHLSGSHAYFCNLAYEVNVEPDTQMQIEHCILAHHGRQEWGSPVEPQTVEASILHYADMLSMRYGANR